MKLFYVIQFLHMLKLQNLFRHKLTDHQLFSKKNNILHICSLQNIYKCGAVVNSPIHYFLKKTATVQNTPQGGANAPPCGVFSQAFPSSWR